MIPPREHVPVVVTKLPHPRSAPGGPGHIAPPGRMGLPATVDTFERLKNRRRVAIPVIEPACTDYQQIRHRRDSAALGRWLARAQPDHRELLLQGLDLLRANRPAEAETFFGKVVLKNQWMGPAFVFLGESLRLQGKSYEAELYLDRGTLLGWAVAGPLVAEGLALWQEKQFFRAEGAFNDAAVVDPTHPMPRFLLGAMRCATGKVQAGLKDLRRAAEASKNHPLVVQCIRTVEQAVQSGEADAVECGIDPGQVACCIDI